MGLYDTISIAKAHLPQDGAEKYFAIIGDMFNGQTKDLDCAMCEFRIVEDRLEKYFCETEWVEGDPNAESWIDRLGQIKEIGEPWWENYPCHAKIRLYDFKHGDEDLDFWIEFELTFTHSKLESIELVECEERPNQERKQREKEIFEQWK